MAQSNVKVYAIRTDTVRKWDLSRLEQRMPERMRKANRFRFEKDRLLCLGAGILLHEALGISDEALIRYRKNGKPFAPGYPAFNLSHSGQWCLLAANGICRQIGVDVEEITPETTFVDDLGADSLDVFQIIMGIEEEFDIVIDTEEAEKIVTVQDAVNAIRSVTE